MKMFHIHVVCIGGWPNTFFGVSGLSNIQDFIPWFHFNILASCPKHETSINADSIMACA